MHRTEELDERLFSDHPENICIRARAGEHPSRCAPELDRPDPLKTSQNAATHKANAMLLELGFGLLTVAVMVLWLGIVLEFFF
jgi:hypothetical protein